MSRPPCPVPDDHPDRWRWILDGAEWVKLPKPHARRMEWWRERIFPAGERAITADDLAIQSDLVELDNRRAASPKGGKADKYDSHLQELVDQLDREHAGATARELREMIPESFDDSSFGVEIYRDGDTVVVWDGGTGRNLRTITTLRGFQSYVARARRERK